MSENFPYPPNYGSCRHQQELEIKALREERDAVIFTYNQADAECAKLRNLVRRLKEALLQLRPTPPGKDISEISDWWRECDKLLAEAEAAK
jgi:hypothetical protein